MTLMHALLYFVLRMPCYDKDTARVLQCKPCLMMHIVNRAWHISLVVLLFNRLMVKI